MHDHEESRKLHVTWSLSGEEPLNPLDPLGDTYLVALVTAVTLLETSNEVTVEILDEPYQVSMKASSSTPGLAIEYRGHHVWFDSRNEFVRDLRQVVGNFLEVMDAASRSTGLEPLSFSELREFVVNEN
jgi:hypothetical protein